MKNSSIVHCTIAVLAASAAFVAITPASANMIGAWNYDSTPTLCSIGTKGNTGKMIMLYTASGASGMLVVPDDQSSLSPGHDYPVKISINGSADSALTSSAIKFGGATVLLVEIKVAGIAAGEADGFAMRVKMNDKPVFDKDMHGSKDAFAAFVGCTKTLTK